MYRINDNKIKHSPRALKFWECCLAVFYQNLSSFKNGQTTTEQETVVNINGLIEDKDHSSIYLDKAYDYYLRANKYHWSSYEVEDKEEYKKKLFQRKVRPFKGKNKSSFVLKQQISVNDSECISVCLQTNLDTCFQKLS